MRYVVVGGLATEEVGGDLLLCDASGTAVHRISGDARRYFERAARGDGELPDDQVTAALVAANVLLPLETGGSISHAEGMSRRQMIALGAAAAAAAGVVTIGLPSAAAAQSPGPAPEPTYPPAPSSGTNPGTDYVVGSTRSTSVTYATWETSSLEQVTFNWALYSPGRIGEPANLIATSETPALGRTPTVTVPGTSSGQTYIWMLTAPDGTNVFVPGTFL